MANPEEFPDFLNDIQNFSAKNRKENVMTAEMQLDRLTNHTFYNPFDVLLLPPEATEEEIKKAYRSISLLVHPDKCSDPRSYDCFHVIEAAYKTLKDVEKRKVYQRVMREARERTDFERKKENKRRTKIGIPLLPEETYESEYKSMVHRLFKDIEDRKCHYIKLQESHKSRLRAEAEEKMRKEKIKQMTEEEWEKTRESRVDNWRKFSENKKSIIGTKKSSKEIRPPMPRQEIRKGGSEMNEDPSLKKVKIN